ncbi:hypothetical protein [Nocardioides albus]|uniref:KOW domain-containing protein n=1 Tax=Nocardioides albus TaxID=1841 RepID=A0A7W5A094_9ACTN|nr:hypothetical protein [Nocardioides albus]MBB3087124.1 hypothetical protein [Nocardioides albus]GGU06783.1 hypothetical protein GCM10007979_00450 [Nocardioides albus]
MGTFSIGQTVRITGKTMRGVVGTVVHHDEKRGKYLVRVDGMTQNYYNPDEIEEFTTG